MISLNENGFALSKRTSLESEKTREVNAIITKYFK